MKNYFLILLFSVSAFAQTDGVSFRRSTATVIQTNLSQTFSNIYNTGGTASTLAGYDANKKLVTRQAVNADIASGAAVDATKIANGSVSNTEFQLLDGITAIGNVFATSTFGTDNLVLRSDGTSRNAQGSATSIDDSGNVSTTGTISAGVGGSNAGRFDMFEGTAVALVPDTFSIYAPTDVAAGGAAFVVPGVAFSGLMEVVNSSGVMTLQQATAGSDFVAPSTTLTMTGTANEITLSAGAQDLSANRTWVFSLPSALTFTGKTITGGSFASPTFTDATAGNVSTNAHGLAPKGDGDTNKFLNGNGAYSVPGGTITVAEVDGTPSVSGVTTIKVTNGTLVDEGSGVVNIRPAATIIMGHANGNYTDGLVIFMGANLATFNTVSGRYSIPSPRTGTIVGFSFTTSLSTLGSDEDVAVALFINGTTAVGSTNVDFDIAHPYLNVTGLTQAVTVGDLIEFRITCPTFATNPVAYYIRGEVIIQ